MASFPKNVEQIKGMATTWAMLGGIFWILGLACVIIGIISEATDNFTMLGLTYVSWYMVAISAFVASVSWYIGWAVSIYLNAKVVPKE